jgi:hypothetical protein
LSVGAPRWQMPYAAPNGLRFSLPRPRVRVPWPHRERGGTSRAPKDPSSRSASQRSRRQIVADPARTLSTSAPCATVTNEPVPPTVPVSHQDEASRASGSQNQPIGDVLKLLWARVDLTSLLAGALQSPRTVSSPRFDAPPSRGDPHGRRSTSPDRRPGLDPDRRSPVRRTRSSC